MVLQCFLVLFRRYVCAENVFNTCLVGAAHLISRMYSFLYFYLSCVVSYFRLDAGTFVLIAEVRSSFFLSQRICT